MTLAMHYSERAVVVGLRELDMGEITLFGQSRPHNLAQMLGYMPQDSALLNLLTIVESLQYFAMIYGMDESEIKKRIDFLTGFLDLRKINNVVRTLSGGQKKRVSLAIAMIHNPRILVLDEPCVGLDTLLRQRIWGYLSDLSKNYGVTIIVSTHYLEETKHCDTVGLMRGGRLLEEDNPSSLLRKCKVETMQEAVLHLCRQDEVNLFAEKFESQNVTKLVSSARLSIKASRKNNIHAMCPPRAKSNHAKIIQALNLKWLTRRRRDWRLLFGELICPILLSLIFKNIVGPEPHGVKFGIIHNDPSFNINDPTCNYNNATKCFENVGLCDFLQNFETDKFTWIHVNAYHDGIRLVEKGDLLGIVEFPANFSLHMRNRMLQRNFADNKTIDGSTLPVQMDESNKILSGWARKIIMDKYLMFIENIAAACSFNVSISKPGLQFRAIYGSIELFDVISSFKPGVIMLHVFLFPMGVAVIWMEDRVIGFEGREYIAGVHLSHRIISAIFSQSCIILIQIGIFLGVMYNFYDVEIKGSWVLAVGLIYSCGITGLILGVMIAALCNRMLDLIFILIMLAPGQLFWTGAIWPPEMAPWIVRQVFAFVPITQMIKALRSICTRGWGITNPVVAMGFLPAVGWITVSLIVLVLAERRRYK
ncbi:ABC transporter G family member 23 [Folsomia candida]|uniref:ABC transporter G family member 23 n=1 Tax=Folsomia candida TaxID=158441 RepID=A0A226E8G3_FOLCA|nr:ABC transporter G family member 23 [Folsomia candida]